MFKGNLPRSTTSLWKCIATETTTEYCSQALAFIKYTLPNLNLLIPKIFYFSFLSLSRNDNIVTYFSGFYNGKTRAAQIEINHIKPNIFTIFGTIVFY